MFNIITFSVDQISKLTTIKVSYQSTINSEILHDGGLFTSPQSAKAWLDDLKKLWLGIRVDKFLIYTADLLNAAKGNKFTYLKFNSLQELQRYAMYLPQKDTSFADACKYFLIEADNFKNVLPPPDHPQRNTLENEINLLINFVKKHGLEPKKNDNRNKTT